MTYINTITDSPNQSLILKLATGDDVALSLTYRENQQGWYYSFTYGNLTVYNRRLTASPNLLRTFRSLIPFGFACTTQDGYEPIYKEDFQNGRAYFFLLNQSDVLAVEGYLQDAQV